MAQFDSRRNGSRRDGTNPTDPVSQLPEQLPSQSTRIPSSVAPSPTLMLPASHEENKADTYFRENLVPDVVEAPSAEVKNDLLTRGIYEYFAEQCGTREQQHKNISQQKHKRHERALKKVTELKKRAKKEFREAKGKGFPQEEIRSIARNFFDLVCQQNKLKKQSNQTAQRNRAKRERQRFHKNFWKFAGEVLDDNQASRVPPKFSGEQAHEYFSSTYNPHPMSTELHHGCPHPVHHQWS